jgi:hypothetical protein
MSGTNDNFVRINVGKESMFDIDYRMRGIF